MKIQALLMFAGASFTVGKLVSLYWDQWPLLLSAVKTQSYTCYLGKDSGSGVSTISLAPFEHGGWRENLEEGLWHT